MMKGSSDKEEIRACLFIFPFSLTENPLSTYLGKIFSPCKHYATNAIYIWLSSTCLAISLSMYISIYSSAFQVRHDVSHKYGEERSRIPPPHNYALSKMLFGYFVKKLTQSGSNF